MKDSGNILRMCLYAPQTKHLQKVFCVAAMVFSITPINQPNCIASKVGAKS